MNHEQDTGVYFLVDQDKEGHLSFIKKLEKFTMTLPGVAVTWNSVVHPHCDECVSSSIRKQGIKKLLLVGEAPGLFKAFFSNMMAKTVDGDWQVDQLSFAEHHAEFSELEKAQQLLKGKLADTPPYDLHQGNGYSVNPATLVIGGGIAGIQAALEIAHAEKTVYLVEKQGTIGGHMAMFDKTFPTLDCAACILTPKMVEVSQNPFIELMTCTELKSVSGRPGDYKVSLLRKARFVSESLCIGCGSCAQKCPSKVPSEFDVGTTMRKAIYMPFPQAVPNKYLIDSAHCSYIQSDGEKCGVCVKFCPVNDCIDLHQKDRVEEISVGNIIVATGYRAFDPTKLEQYGYKKYKNVLTSLELERLTNAGGPTEGKVVLRSEDKKGNWIFHSESSAPKSVALIHCVGSRDVNNNTYCSRVCCMQSLKLAHLVKEKLPDAEVYEHFIDMRAFGKGYEEFYQRIKAEGIRLIRGKTALVTEVNGKLMMRSEDIENHRILEREVDMVVLTVGLEAVEDASKIAGQLGIQQSSDGWMTESNYLIAPTGSTRPGIHLAGVCQGPKDIPDTVAQASSAAARVLKSITKVKELATI